MPIHIQCITIDCREPHVLSRFWSQALGWRITDQEPTEHAVEPPEESPASGICPDLLFIKVDEDKTAKNRVHLDLRPTDQEAEIERLIALGARRVDIGQSGNEAWVVLADPEGNEFCVLRALSEDDELDG